MTEIDKTKVKAFLALANNDRIGEHGIANRKWGIDFIQKLKDIGDEKMQVNSRDFAEEQHGTVEMLSWYYGLRALFKS